MRGRTAVVVTVVAVLAGGPAAAQTSQGPPALKASHGTQRVTGTLGSYCWRGTDAEAPSICADAIGPRPSKRALRVRPRWTIALDTVLPSDALTVQAGELRLRDGVPRFVVVRELTATRASPRRWAVRLPRSLRGIRLLSVVATFPGRGDASYGVGLRPAG